MIHELLAARSVVPVIAILRGVRPDEVLSVCEALIVCGIRMIEIPLNSPAPLESIERAVAEFGGDALIGAGTVLDEASVKRLSGIGAELVVTPNTDPSVIRAALRHNMVVLPGAMTPTELFAAHKAGANGAKLFPASVLGPRYLKDVRAVLPPDFLLCAVGGVDASNAQHWMDAGATALGIGSSLYAPGDTPDLVKAKAKSIAAVVSRVRE